MKVLELLSRKEKIMFALTCIIYSLSSLLLAYRTYINSTIISFIESQNAQYVIYTAVYAIVLLFLDIGLDALSTKLRVKCVCSAELKIKKDIMSSILKRDSCSFRDKDNAYWINLLSGDIDSYKNEVISTIPFVVYSIISLVSVSIVLFLFSPWMFLLGSILTIVPLFLMKPLSKLQSRLRKSISDANELYMETMKENVEGYGTIRMTGSEENAYYRYVKVSEERGRTWKHGAFWFNFTSQIFVQLAGFSNIFCICLGGILTITGNMSLSMLYASSSYLSQLSNQANNLIDNIVGIKSVNLIKEKILTESKSNSIKDEKKFGLDTIEFKNVSFGFVGRKIFSDFSYTFNPGKCYALIGESGCGKSTLIHLIMKWFKDYDGQILVGGYDIRTMSEQTLFSSISVVDQRPHIFNATFFENITMFGSSAFCSDDRYRKIIHDVNLEKVEMMVGNSLMGDFGSKLSGGEIQRIAIARAMFRDPKILIMDEPTTGLDSENMEIINNFIQKHSELTRIVITHDDSVGNLSKFDAVLLMKNGKIKEERYNER